jgi:2'-5' RNA ligase
MRLFLALNLPPEERARLHREAAPLRAAALPVRWVAPDALHLTLNFLGEVAEGRAAEVESAMERVAQRFPPFELRLRRLGAFPNFGRARVVWVGVDAPPELGRLQAALTAGLAGLGFPPEDRPYSPHLTLGRAQSGARPPELRPLERLAGEFRYEAAVEVRTVDLMRSHLGGGGARYERLRAAPLHGASAGPEGAGD